ncbi:MAG: transcription-repair coupling factor [Hyphomicrobiales bacterium]|nr:transcription-repair coupling factor [Hyphomicrobiales bacterium]
MFLPKRALDELTKGGSLTLGHVPGGFDAFLGAEIARQFAGAADAKAAVFLHVARDGQRSAAFREALRFADPGIEALEFPAWDCQPYDRISPNPEISARRMTVLARLARTRSSIERPRVICATLNGLVQRLPPVKHVALQSLSAAPGNALSMEKIAEWLATNGFMRASTVNETGEFALRGGILDLFAPGMPFPVRLDFFGDTLESIRSFDVESQRSLAQLRALDLVPMSEVQLTTDSIRAFRRGYIEAFGGETRNDELYEAISEGRRHPGMEHWAPLFWGSSSTLFDYLPGVPLLLDPQIDEAARDRFAGVADYYTSRRAAYDASPRSVSYKPLPPEALYLDGAALEAGLARRSVLRFAEGEVAARPGQLVVAAGAASGRNFAPERLQPDVNVFEAALDHIKEETARGRRVIVAGFSDGSRERLSGVLGDHGAGLQVPVSSLAQAREMTSGIALAVLPLEAGFIADGICVISEQDILGDRLVKTRKKVKAENFLTELSSLTAGDLVVHVDHGIGRFVGLKTMTVLDAEHDFLELHYADNKRLFLPVENLELLSRYGAEGSEAALDTLGGAGWQARKARLKKRILEMAAGLIRLAAQRLTREAPRLLPEETAYHEFCARFPYDETEDQNAAIQATLDDMGAGRPMDRLVCGDVGFGKTEVALRAAFVAAMSGKQVAVVVPTTLLARQHYRTFVERFANLPLRLGSLSRMVSAADQKATRAGVADGTVDIVVGTHALLGKTIAFKNLGLVIVDEEQHFGVGHKERLKSLRAEVHVLTLSATPIPRTLQLALTGVRELSLITTPPVDRLAVRSLITPFDELTVREALLRERYRGGQSFFVCPRIEDLDEAAAFLRQHVPEVKFTTCHGQLAATELEDKMSAFYEGKYDVLLATAIVESGLDIPRANTLIVYRADMFGLAQLYQLRGRVGRSKLRAYALFTTPAARQITPQAEKRLHVLQSLDTLGAGFQLASHDLDIRGAGNLLGDEQSGHIREVGYELYQQMLTDAVAALKAGEDEPVHEAWSPTITLGTPVTIPESYVPDLPVRLTLYKRLAALETEAEIESVGAEMIDRFGSLPTEVNDLLQIMVIKALCRRANIEKLDAGPKGVIIAFRDNSFGNPAALVRYISQQGPEAKVRQDMKIVFIRDFTKKAQRLAGTRKILMELVSLAERRKAA